MQHRAHPIGLVLAMLLTGSPVWADGGLSVGFEFAEGFDLGPLHGQQGWTGDFDQPGDTSIEFVPQFGSRGVRITADGGFDGAFHLGAASPVFEPPPSRVVSAEQDIIIDEAGGADFLVQTVDSVKGQPAVTLQFAFGGDLLVNAADTGFNWTPGTTMAVAIEHDQLLGTAAVFVNAASVASDVDISHIDRIDELQYGTDDFVSGTAASLYLDNIVVVPEPASVLLLLFGGGVAFRHRRRR